VTRAFRGVPILVLALVATGCSLPDIFKRRPPLEQYILRLPETDNGVPSVAGPPVLNGTLAIAPFETRGIYDERGIVFRIDDHQLGAHPSREWAIPLRDMLGRLSEEVLSRAPLTAAPAEFDAANARSRDYQWRGTVREFEEVNRGREVLAAVHFEVEIIRTANDSVVWKGAERMERAVPPPTNSMTRVVETLSALTGDVLSRLIARARTDLGVPTTAAASAPPPN
jgi:uncharacterized lipoprotein YmbA